MAQDSIPFRMRRRCSLLAILVLGSFPSPDGLAAQTSLIVQAGVSVGRLWGLSESGLSTETRVGARGGISVMRPLTGRLGLQAGAVYVQAGGTELGGGLDHKLSIDYVEIPVLVRIELTREGVRSHLLLGPTVSFTTHCESIYAGPATYLGQGEKRVGVGCGEDDAGAIESGALAALGLDIPISPRTSITTDLLYDIVLTPIDPGKLRTWAVVTGIMLELE